MSGFLVEADWFWPVVSLAAYFLGMWLVGRFHWAVFNPMLIAIGITIGAVALSGSNYEQYQASAQSLSSLLTPATVCLAIPLYEKLAYLKKNMRAILAGILAGVLTSLVSILALSALFGLDHQQYVTLLPKSVTTAIGIGISQEFGGLVSVTAAVIAVTGVLGNVTGAGMCKLLHIRDPVAQGVALGTSAHVIGTARAMEMDELAGAVSSLSIAVAGILTVLCATVFSIFL